jgi:hypothetical protein
MSGGVGAGRAILPATRLRYDADAPFGTFGERLIGELWVANS